MIAWITSVKEIWVKNKHKAGYKFTDALKDAKKIYEK
jgi:hypothetical protein